MRGKCLFHEGLVQQIAVSIIDNQENSPSNSPLVPSPESTRDGLISSTNSPTNIAPIPRTEGVSPELKKQTSTTISCPSEDRQPIIAMIGVASSSNVIHPLNEEMSMEHSPLDDDDEAQLLAQLETERLAEEKARQKRRKLEERLASARGKKPQSSARIIPEGGGDGGHGNITESCAR